MLAYSFGPCNPCMSLIQATTDILIGIGCCMFMLHLIAYTITHARTHTTYKHGLTCARTHALTRCKHALTLMYKNTIRDAAPVKLGHLSNVCICSCLSVPTCISAQASMACQVHASPDSVQQHLPTSEPPTEHRHIVYRSPACQFSLTVHRGWCQFRSLGGW